MDLTKLIDKASDSKFHLWKLNRILWLGIPFNKPHRFKILRIEEGYAKVSLPYRRSNLNHIKTIHACAMATCSEYVSGLVLGTKFNFKEYRLIMRDLKMDYHFQGKMNAFCEFHFTPEDFQNVIKQLENKDSVDIAVQVKCVDEAKNHLATASINWQIKPWVKTRSQN